MKLLSFSHKGRESWGAQIGESIVDLGAQTSYPTLMAFIASPDYARREEIVKGKAATIPSSEIKYLPVITRPEKIILLVRNYLDHHQEVVAAGLQRELSQHPPIFMRYWQSQVGHNEPIIRPKCSVELDWEGEMAVIIGKGGRHIPESEAMSKELKRLGFKFLGPTTCYAHMQAAGLVNDHTTDCFRHAPLAGQKCA